LPCRRRGGACTGRESWRGDRRRSRMRAAFDRVSSWPPSGWVRRWRANLMPRAFLTIVVCLAAVSCGRVPPAVAPVNEPTTPTKELPKDWVLEDIIDAMPPRSDNGPTDVLAWKIVEDDRPWRVEYCLAIKHLRKPTENQEHWVLASLAHSSREGKEWNF